MEGRKGGRERHNKLIKREAEDKGIRDRERVWEKGEKEGEGQEGRKGGRERDKCTRGRRPTTN